MPPDFGPRLAVDFAGRPPHMSAVDFILWQRYRRVAPLPFVSLFFDVAVGAGASPAAGVTPEVATAWARLTRQRIDAVGERPDGWTLIEVRGAAGPGALGSLLVYRDLWLADPPDRRPILLVLVTDVFPENLLPSLALQGIQLVLV